MPVILAIRRLRQEHQEFQSSLNKTFSQSERGKEEEEEEGKNDDKSHPGH